jgi:hypothetical protein
MDQTSSLLKGANVSVTIKNGTTTVVTKATVMDASGYHAVTLGRGEWEPWLTIEVTADYNTFPETRDVADDASSPQQVDIAYPFEIAQFGSLIRFPASAAFVGIVGAFYVRSAWK